MEEEARKEKIEECVKESRQKFQQIEEMINKGEYCTDIVKKVREMQSALDRLNQCILDCHLHECLKDAIWRGDEERIFEEILYLIKYRP